jgi:hypothetical protein
MQDLCIITAIDTISQWEQDSAFCFPAQRGVADGAAVAGDELKQGRLQALDEVRHLGAPVFFLLALPGGGTEATIMLAEPGYVIRLWR